VIGQVADDHVCIAGNFPAPGHVVPEIAAVGAAGVRRERSIHGRETVDLQSIAKRGFAVDSIGPGVAPKPDRHLSRFVPSRAPLAGITL